MHDRADIHIVGDVPAGLPPITVPTLSVSTMQSLFPMALTISLIAFIEATSIAKVMASKRRQKLDANQDLIALGASNLGAAFTGGYPVSGGLSRSMVNFSSGANTGLASIITASLILLTVMFFTPLFTYLPNAVLASIIIVAVTGLMDSKPLRQAWRYNHLDAASFLITFFAVLILDIQMGIMIGVGVSLLLYLWQTSHPHVAIVGRIGDSEHFRNVLRHDVKTCDHVLAVRIDESLYFANAQTLETMLLGCIADCPQVDHLLLICSAVNYIDSSALEVLKQLNDELADSRVTLHFAEVKGPVMDRLKAIGFVGHIGEDRFFLSTHLAMQSLDCCA